MKKFLSILMAAAMMLALIPMAGTAEEPDTNKLVLYTSAGASEYELIVTLPCSASELHGRAPSITAAAAALLQTSISRPAR